MTVERNKPKKRRAPARKADAAAEGVPPGPDTGTTGEILRAARQRQGLELEDVAAAINLRVGQLRALEEGNLDALPGMAYAVGFIKSYANHLRLDGVEISRRFKEEHGGPDPAAQHLAFPEPIADGPQPDMLIIGAAVFCAILLLVSWAIFSGGDDAQERAEIPPAPVVGTVTGLSAPPLPADTLPAEEAPAVAALPPVLPVAEAPPPEAPAAVPAAAPAPAPEKTVAEEKKKEDEGIIRVTRGKGRVMLEARQPSWIDVRDAGEKSVFSKLLRAGEQYYVPDQKGMTLITTNAGGLDIYVDGGKVQAIGGPGDVVRGVELDPGELQKVRIRSRDRARN